MTLAESCSADTPERLTHAGGVVLRVVDEQIEVLLVRATPPPHDWVLPKGHIEPGETAGACAHREVCEEAGVDAEVVSPLGYDRFVTPQGKVVNAAFFLMHYRGAVPSLDTRECRWFTIDDALDALAFDGARRLVRSVER
ncbi:MAG: NUDIX domain-containing protein [Vicinamibacterales bacterium]